MEAGLSADAPIVARHGAAATSQRLATQVAVDLLRAGGSAVDAALGANAMLSLIEPHMCGPGGDLFALVWEPGERRLHGLNASGRAARGLSLADLRARLGDATTIPIHGVHSMTVPGAVRGWQALHERFGRLDLGAIYAPVIDHARRGVEIGPATAAWWTHAAAAVQAADIGALAAGFISTFLPAGAAPTAGTRFRNPALATTYAGLAARGFDDFYGGELGARLVDYLAACGSPVDAADLAAASAEWVTPITTSYRGYDIYELPPNGQGLAVLQILNMLESLPLADCAPHGHDYWHAFIEAKKLAFEDRARFYADPAFSAVPIAALADKAYAAQRIATLGVRANQAPRPGAGAIAVGDTTYLTVADERGMMVSLIQSIFQGFGCGLAPPELGFALQCRGAGFTLEADRPNSYAPGKRPFHTIIPAFVMQGGEPYMAFGVMGGDVQPQGQVQVLVNHLDFGMDIQAAGAAPRMRHDGLNSPSQARESDGGVVFVEDGFAPALLAALEARGHELKPASHAVTHFMGGYQCIRRTSTGWQAASEPRFDGCALGY
ncbi:MAG: gamma-glutamyltransferase family protein [Proteobacteria bacterium]|nr:gamma-glutamyltransferase family protein [Pseudomonadota bacterium]